MGDKRLDLSLENKVALVTGGTKGIGRALSQSIAEAGAETIVISRTEADCQKVAAELTSQGLRASGIPADVSNKKSIEEAVNRIMEKYGQIDVLVNNAGVSLRKNFVDYSEEEWDHVLDINLKGVFFTSQVVGKEMLKLKKGVIINMASVLGMVGQYFVAPYCASKGGIIQLTKSLALEWAVKNIRVNAVAPAYIVTELNKDKISEESTIKYLKRQTPMRRLGETDEVVGAVLFLASEHASYITGQVLCVDGGWTAQ